MKRFIAIAAALIITLIYIPVLADGADAANALSSLWETEGYPEDVGGVFYDQTSGKCGVLLTQLSRERESEILALTDYPEDVFFVQCSYSHKDMFVAQQQITAGYISDKKIVGVGIGWISDDNGVTGFGESGYEMRVVVDVTEENYDEMYALLSGVYGDMVYLEISSPITAEDNTAELHTQTSDGEKPNIVLYICIGIFFAATVTVFVFWLIRMKERHIDGK